MRCWRPSQNTTSIIHFKHGKSAGNGTYERKGTTSRAIVANRPQVNFWPDGSTSPGNYGLLFVVIARKKHVQVFLPYSILFNMVCFWSYFLCHSIFIQISSGLKQTGIITHFSTFEQLTLPVPRNWDLCWSKQAYLYSRTVKITAMSKIFHVSNSKTIRKITAAGSSCVSMITVASLGSQFIESMSVSLLSIGS
jgi:hypothetical protein